MGWTLEQIESMLKELNPEERQGLLEKGYSREDLEAMFDVLMDELLSIQQKMSIYHNGYEEIKKGEDPSKIKNFLIRIGIFRC